MMKNDKLKQCEYFPATKPATIDSERSETHNELNNDFWNSLRESIKMKGACPKIKGRILIAKRILTPIIQDLMTDALEQINEETRDVQTENPFNKKEVNVLFNNVNATKIWNSGTATKNDSDKSEWALRILSEISRDLEKSFARISNAESNSEYRQVSLNKTLLTRLVMIHEHLGNIIERLNERRAIERRPVSVRALKDTGFYIKFPNLSTSDRGNEEYLYRKISEHNQRTGNSELANLNRKPVMNLWQTFQRGMENYQMSGTGYRVSDDRRDRNESKSSVLSKEHRLFEEGHTYTGNKEIVIKCLEDLEKVRKYLEALRYNEECDKPTFSGLESCKNENCRESHPHLHTNLPNTPMVLKLNKHADENELENDLIIGFPGITKSSPDVHLLLNRKKQYTNLQESGNQQKRITNQKRLFKESKIPKLVHRKRVDIVHEKPKTSMRITVQRKGDRKKSMNLIVFDPDDPCRSIIKMKEQETPEYGKRQRAVSRTFFVRLKRNESRRFIFLVVFALSRLDLRNPFWPEIERGASKRVARATSNSDEAMNLKMYFVTTRTIVILWNELVMVVLDEMDFARFYMNPRVLLNLCVSEKKLTRSFPHKQLANYSHRNIDLYMKEVFTLLNMVKGGRYSVSYFGNSKLMNSNPISMKSVKKTDHFLPGDTLTYLKHSTYEVRFFGCFWEKGGKSEAPKKLWTNENVSAYPAWTIKKSKYYDVPKKKTTPKFEQPTFEDSIEKMDTTMKSELEAPDEIQMQVSQVSICAKSSISKHQASDTDKLNAKTEVKRKVSFRDEVDIAGSGVNYKEAMELQDQNIPEYVKNSWEDVKGKKEKPTFEDIEEIKSLSENISELLMTDSLVKIGEAMSQNLRPPKKSISEDLDLTSSARNILEKISKTFERGDKNSVQVLETLDGRLMSQFYDGRGERISEVYDRDGHLVGRDKAHDILKFASILFDSEGFFIKNRYDFRGKRIEGVYDEHGNVIKRVVWRKYESEDAVDGTDLKRVMVLERSDSKANLQKNCTSKSKFSASSFTKDTHQQKWRRENDSLTKLLEDETIPRNRGNESLIDKGMRSLQKSSSRKLFDREGNLLTGIYDKRGKPLTVTSSGETEKLVPYLFDKKGRIQCKRYDSKGRELKAVFDEDGTEINGLSICWLNELLKASSEKKREPFFKRKSRNGRNSSEVLMSKHLFDLDGKIITSVYDSKGKPLVISPSGQMQKLIPVLFDGKGRFRRKYYDQSRKKLRSVHDEQGNLISSISLTTMNRILDKEMKKSTNVLPVVEACEESERKAGGESDVAEIQRSITNFHQKTAEVLSNSMGGSENGLVDEAVLKNVDSVASNRDVAKEKKYGNESIQKLRSKDNERLLKEDFDDEKDIVMTINNGKESVCNITTIESNQNQVNDQNLRKTKLKNIDKKVNNRKRSINQIEVKKQSSILASIRKHSSVLGKTRDHSGLEKNEPPSKRETKMNSLTVNNENQMGKTENHDGKQLRPNSSISTKQSMEFQLEVSRKNLTPKAGESINKFFDQTGNVITEVYDRNGKLLKRTKLGEVEQLAPFLFDKNGLLQKDVYDKSGNNLTCIYDEKGRSISKISIPSEDQKMARKDDKIPGSVYDQNGYLVKHIYDKKGHPIIITRLAKLEDLAPIIFDEKGVRRKIYNRQGFEIGPIYDHLGNQIRHAPVLKRTRNKLDYRRSKIFNESGRPLLNFYNSEGNLIIGLYNDNGRPLCVIKKGQNNAEKLSDFFFDKHGHFLKGRFFDYRGMRIKCVYDSDDHIIRNIRRVRTPRVSHHRPFYPGHRRTNKESRETERFPTEMRYSSKHRPREYYGKSEVRPVENLTRHLTSEKELILDRTFKRRTLGSSESSSSDEDLISRSISMSLPSIKLMAVKKFFDRRGKLLTGVYNSKDRLLGYSASGNARVLAPYLFDANGNFMKGRYDIDREALDNLYDSRGNLVEKIPTNYLKKPGEIESEKKGVERKHRFHDVPARSISSLYDASGRKVDLKHCNDLFYENLYDSKGVKIRTDYDDDRSIVRKISPKEIYSVSEHQSEIEEDIKEEKDRKQYTLFGGFKDKLLTVIFDNSNRLSDRISFDKIPRNIDKAFRKMIPRGGTCRIDEAIRRITSFPLGHSRRKEERPPKESKNVGPKSDVFDKFGNMIVRLYDQDGRKIFNTYDAKGNVTFNLYSPSGNLIKNNFLKAMFEEEAEFTPKAYGSRGNLITNIYANKNLITRVYDKNGKPAKVDSDLIYVVSEQSLPTKIIEIPKKRRSKKAKHVNYFSEGETNFYQGQSFESEHRFNREVVLYGQSVRRVDECTCEQCQTMGRQRRNLRQLGGDMMRGLNKYTIPLDKFFPRAFFRRGYGEDEGDESDVEMDSLEELIENVLHQKGVVHCRNHEKQNKPALLEEGEKLPISRKCIEQTLAKCAHFCNSSEGVGKVSNTVIDHFTTLILKEIKGRFYRKLGEVQNGANKFSNLGGSHRQEVCIGTELKFEDSLIGRHNFVQTSLNSLSQDIRRMYASCLDVFGEIDDDVDPYGDSDVEPLMMQNSNNVFMCKFPNSPPFMILLGTPTEKNGADVEE